MECKEIQKEISEFDNNELSLKEEEHFIDHVEECSDCKEELEIYYIVRFGFNEENVEDTKEYQKLIDSYDFKGLVDLKLENSRKKVEKAHEYQFTMSVIFVLANTMVLLTLLIMILLLI